MYTRIEIGDTVTIKNPGKFYEGYYDWAKLHDLKKYPKPTPKNPYASSGALEVGTKVRVVAKGYQGNIPGRILLGVEHEGKHYIIETTGVKR